MRIFLLAMLVCAAITAQAAETDSVFRLRRMLAPAGLCFLSGGAWGLHEKTAHHWPVFSRRFPGARAEWWNPEISWRRKYGRKGPVWFSDAKHLLASSTQVFGFLGGCCVFLGEKRPWWHYALQVAGSGVGYCIGNELTFNWIYKK